MFQHLPQLRRRSILDEIQGNSEGLTANRAHFAGPEASAYRLRRHDGGPVENVRRWRHFTPATWSILSMVIDPEKSDRLILGTERMGIQVSDNGGQTYRASNQGFSHRRIVDAATDPQHPGRALVVLTSSFEPLLETKDAGRTWTPLGAGLTSGPPRHIFASPEGWLAAPGPGGLMRYDKLWASWVAVDQVIEKGAPWQPREIATAMKTLAGGPKSPAKSATSAAVKLTVPF